MQFSRPQIWVIVSAALVFALLFGVQQSRALFIGPLNTSTGLGIAAISLAFACARLPCWYFWRCPRPAPPF